MNHTYRCLFNTALGTWVAVPETARYKGKSGGKRLRGVVSAALFVSMASWSCAALADGAGGGGFDGSTGPGAAGGAGTGSTTQGNGGARDSMGHPLAGSDGILPDGTAVAGGSIGVVSTNSGPDATGGTGTTAMTMVTAGTLAINAGQRLVGGGGGSANDATQTSVTFNTDGGAGGVALVVQATDTTVNNAGGITGGGGGGAYEARTNTTSFGHANGGAGADAIDVAADRVTIVNASTGTITGGGGGGGGYVGSATASALAAITNGGVGGIAVSMGGADGTLVNNGSIAGGNGGNGGRTVLGSSTLIVGTAGAGAAGVSVTGSGNTITNAGTIRGGVSGGSTAVRANAVTLSGANNTLELQSGYAFVGNVVSSDTSNVLVLGGATDASFNLNGIVSTIASPYNATTGTQYTGFGHYAKNDSSTWTLSGSSTVAMDWAVNGGTLAVNGSMTNATITVNAGADLQGSGVVGASNIGTGGTLTAATLGGGLQVNGNLSFATNSSYLVALASNGTSGVTHVSGDLTIANGTTLTLSGAAGTYTGGNLYTILTYTGTRSGTFSNVSFNYAYVTPSVSYTTGAVQVTLSPTSIFASSGFGSVGTNANQNSVARALDLVFAAGGNGVTSALYTASADDARRALTSLSGDSTLSFGRLAASQFRGAQSAVGQHLVSVDMSAGGASGVSSGEAARDADPWIAVSAAQTRQSADASSGVGGYSDRSTALSMGHDWQLNDHWLIGAALSADVDTLSYDNATASGRSNGVQAAMYARYRPSDSPFFIKGMASVGRWSNTLSRQVSLGTLSADMHGDFNTTGGALYGETGLTLPLASLVVEPFVGASLARYRRQAYAESTDSGSDLFALRYAAQSTTDSATQLGTRLRQIINVGGQDLTWQAELNWQHRIGASTPASSAAFETAADDNFQIQGAAAARDEVTLRLGASYAINDATSANMQASAMRGEGERTYAGTVGVRWLW